VPPFLSFIFYDVFFLIPDFVPKSPRKKSSYSGKCMGTKDVYNHGKKGLDIETPLAILNIQI